MRQDRPRWTRRGVLSAWRGRLVPAGAILCLFHALTGCVLETVTPELALDTPAKYRYAHGAADAAVPKIDWWRGFRSRELVKLIEDAQEHNFDIAVAVAQIEQADAQVKIAQAPRRVERRHRNSGRQPLQP